MSAPPTSNRCCDSRQRQKARKRWTTSMRRLTNCSTDDGLLFRGLLFGQDELRLPRVKEFQSFADFELLNRAIVLKLLNSFGFSLVLRCHRRVPLLQDRDLPAFLHQ